MLPLFTRLLARVSTIGYVQDEDPESRLNRTVLVYMSLACSVCGSLWALFYLLIGAGPAGNLPLLYPLFSLSSLLLFHLTRRFDFFRSMQLFLILVMPFAVQTALGGYVAGSGVVVWSILSPLGALMFSGPNRALPWLLGYLGALAAAVLLEAPASGWSAPIPGDWRVHSFAINIFGVSLVIYLLGRYFAVQKEHLQREVESNALKLLRMGELDQENEKLIKLDEMKDSFLSAVSHELRTPLTSIQGYSKLLAGGGTGGGLDGTQKEFLDIILHNVQRLYTLVSDLLDISRLESRSFQLELAEARPGEIVDRSIASLKVLADSHRIRLERKDGAAPAVLRADASRLEQMIVNLIGNAIKFTPEGGTIRAGAEKSSRNGVEGVLFRVEDTGMGIPRESLPKVFERFYQVDHALSRKFGGTGLGLAISRMIVEAHGGDIWVESELGKGSSFYAFIPFEREGPKGVPVESQMDFPPGGP